MAAESVTELPEGPDWLYELKLDGYRALLIKDGSKIQIRSRNDKDLTPMYPVLASAAAQLVIQQVVLEKSLRWMRMVGRLFKPSSTAAYIQSTTSCSTRLMSYTWMETTC